jgi:hypothetical protein
MLVRAAYSLVTPPHHIIRGQAMTNIYIMIFFGIALVIGTYFAWVLLRREMKGRPKLPPDPYDFGFGPPPPGPKSRN